MDPCIQISKINDFIFCPYSLYYHSIYENFSAKIYHSSSQTKGKIKHENIDEGRYSTAKKFLQGIDIYSEKYGLCGKIINQVSCYKILAIFMLGDASLTTVFIRKAIEFGISIFLMKPNFEVYASIESKADGNYLLRMK